MTLDEDLLKLLCGVPFIISSKESFVSCAFDLETETLAPVMTRRPFRENSPGGGVLTDGIS